MGFDTSHIFDTALGLSIRDARGLIAMTQALLAARTGLPLLQIQKYERGLIRVAPAHLVAIARALRTSVYDLIEAVVGESQTAPRRDAAGLLTAYSALQPPRDKLAMLSFARELAAEENRQAGG